MLLELFSLLVDSEIHRYCLKLIFKVIKKSYQSQKDIKLCIGILHHQKSDDQWTIDNGERLVGRHRQFYIFLRRIRLIKEMRHFHLFWILFYFVSVVLFSLLFLTVLLLLRPWKYKNLNFLFFFSWFLRSRFSTPQVE